MNALKEFNNLVNRVKEDYKADVVAFQISVKHVFIAGNLNDDTTQEEMDELIQHLDLEYDDGYGTQELYGRVWFTNGVWAERHEYDGSECWLVKSYPELPEFNRRDLRW